MQRGFGDTTHKGKTEYGGKRRGRGGGFLLYRTAPIPNVFQQLAERFRRKGKKKRRTGFKKLYLGNHRYTTHRGTQKTP
jgi:hypothetical protein